MYKILLAGFLLLFYLPVESQEAISFSYNYGDIAVHTPYIEPLITGPVHGFSINYAFSNKTGTEWRKLYNFPDVGINYNYKNYNNPEVLGTSHSFTAYLQVPFVRIGQFLNLGFKGATGLGLFTKKYDVRDNSLNQAISSTVNFTVEPRVYSRLNLHPVFLEYSYGLNHFSNGLIKSPNLGINVFNNNFSMGYYFEEGPPPNIRNQQAERNENYEVWAVSSMGIKQIESDPRKYLYTGLTVNFAVYLSRINTLGIGVDVHNDPSLLTYVSKKDRHPGADNYFRYGINLHHEFLLGNAGIFGGYGYYLRDTPNNPSKRYYKAGFKYYYKKVIAMALIRAIPLFRAEVVELGIGYRFIKDKEN